ncbi:MULTISPECIES: prephenate dehydratase [unclassified Streptococcus]|uniref:prephenate dehydratase n=1 Tax=unclassified Streptococcus TaxID=2608887 RepID=UPI0010728613|nr:MULTISPECIES: prephenate dehydratase [unclassified Streptococcus]MBF0786902.1 prephenate dehydratase [Streptococcus sp. 19428wC2_LYSM12]MCQ9212686.1 prephenate dehydratase [Streptococcus sp. B01]MCQ9214027.1 prephenate dehydratase [Streptococcus sp. O1]TFV06270.1 prephenate dehydratase [Streptococcus sp. LYSM12]
MYIGFLGPRGSFTHQVAHQTFPAAELVPYDTITEVMKAVEQHAVDYSVIPVENSIEGSVHETIDYLFHQADLRAVAEVIQPIFQQLMVTSHSRDIQVIYSHPQALAQGKKYIDAHYPQARLEATASTAYAARFVASHPDQPFAAIAPQAAAQEYGLNIVAQDIQEMNQNYTRFWVLGKSALTLPLASTVRKCSLALTLPDNLPGALYKAMSVFAWRGIDLTKIESRPLKTALGEYFFILDVGNPQPELLDYALKELTSLGISYKILGDYFIYQAQ